MSPAETLATAASGQWGTGDGRSGACVSSTWHLGKIWWAKARTVMLGGEKRPAGAAGALLRSGLLKTTPPTAAAATFQLLLVVSRGRATETQVRDSNFRLQGKSLLGRERCREQSAGSCPGRVVALTGRWGGGCTTMASCSFCFGFVDDDDYYAGAGPLLTGPFVLRCCSVAGCEAVVRDDIVGCVGSYGTGYKYS